MFDDISSLDPQVMVGLARRHGFSASAAVADEEMNRLVLQLANVAEKHGIRFPAGKIAHALRGTVAVISSHSAHAQSVRQLLTIPCRRVQVFAVLLKALFCIGMHTFAFSHLNMSVSSRMSGS